MSYLSTIAWLHKTFPTRQRAAELLRPELEEHVLSLHDYELAARFLPGPNMDWHLACGAGTSTAVYGYGCYLARPRWDAWRLRLASAAAFLVGSMYGTFRQSMVHYRFANSLENPQGFIIALNRVDKRLGGSGQIGFAFREMMAKKPEIKSGLDHPGHVQDTGTVAGVGWDRSQDNIEDNVSRSGPAPVRTRWDEIRTANSRSAGQSSWDIIRQHHERSRLPDSSTPNVSPSLTEVDERAAAQAKFDALLEAERRRGQSQCDPE